MIKHPTAKIPVPSDSSALRDTLKKTLHEKYPSVDFAFEEGGMDCRCRILETNNFAGPALAEAIRVDVMRIESQFR